MENPKKQFVDRLKDANNVLVTVSRNPSVDQLSAAIGMTLALNKIGKHASAVFSGEVPSNLEFLQPDLTIEKNTDSLRDFIIALDKAKADKLRYKVEDKLVKIFITPYRTSLSEDDLVFSQGDFNVDVVVAIGVQAKEDLDEAITAHGRILHDATVVTVNTTTSGQMGAINWIEAAASSLCEMVTGVVTDLKAEVLDNQIATALLTGIVAETDRFSNEKTTSDTMNMSAKLMAAGANQQLVATKLQETSQAAEPKPAGAEEESKADDSAESNDGTLQIKRDQTDDAIKDILNPEQDEKSDEKAAETDAEPKKSGRAVLSDSLIADAPKPPKEDNPLAQVMSGQPLSKSPLADDAPAESPKEAKEEKKKEAKKETPEETKEDAKPPVPDELKLPPVESPMPSSQPGNVVDQTLADLEKKVESTQADPGKDEAAGVPDADAARQAIDQVMSAAETPPKPIDALGAAGSLNIDHQADQAQPATSTNGAAPAETKPHVYIDEEGQFSYAPPPVPPPMPMPPANQGPPKLPTHDGQNPQLPPVNY